MPIMDCDEVYNYWEPLHFLLQGSGLQTWEYAHEYALRTYAYLLPLVGVSRLWEAMIPSIQSLNIVPMLLVTTDTVTSEVSSKLVLFLLLRSSLAAWMAYAEVQFCAALEQTKTVSPTIARWTLFVLQTSAGLAHASGALLPSTTWTVAWLLAATCLIRHQTHWFVFYAVTATLSIGWPFGVLVLVPLGLYVLGWQTLPPENGSGPGAMGSPAHIQGIVRLVVFIVGVTAAVQAVVMVIDHHYYGIWTSPNLNIFRYNAQGGGDELYGVEPTSYYIKNLLLNFNGVVVLGVLSLAVVAVSVATNTSLQQKAPIVLVLLSPIYLWFAIVVPRPHKEERFLFPIYPIICFGAVVTGSALVAVVLSGLEKVSKVKGSSTHRSLLHGCLWIPMAALSCLRTLALKKYYAAPLSIYAALQSTADTSEKHLVCTCGEWYRFPSSFTLPHNHELAFLASSFKGQLPQPFSFHGSLKESQDVLQPFNDQNGHEPTRYSALEDCTYVIDLEESSDCQVPSSAKAIATAPFLDADRTTSTLHRTLYIPKLHEKGMARGTIQYQNYVLYKL